MKYRTRIYYTEEQKAFMWDRWKKGNLQAIREHSPSVLRNLLMPQIRPAVRITGLDLRRGVNSSAITSSYYLNAFIRQ